MEQQKTARKKKRQRGNSLKRSKAKTTSCAKGLRDEGEYEKGGRNADDATSQTGCEI